MAAQRHFLSPSGSFNSDTILTNHFQVHCLELERSGKKVVLHLALQLDGSDSNYETHRQIVSQTGSWDVGIDVGNSCAGCCDRVSVAFREVWKKLGGNLITSHHADMLNRWEQLCLVFLNVKDRIFYLVDMC